VTAPDAWLEDVEAATTFIGDGAESYRERIGTKLGASARFHDVLQPPLAGTIARLAAARALIGDTPAPDDIAPLYVRRPDVELAREGRGGR
jgi:hypothetical protein